jgi:hypothetical protein
VGERRAARIDSSRCKTQPDGFDLHEPNIRLGGDGDGAIYVFADDHGPPHAYARHRGKGWVARVRFSYAGSAVALISIAPLKNVPLQRVVNALLDDVQARQADCRRSWWTTRQTTCLANRWTVVPSAEKIELHSERTPSAKQIADATYDPATGGFT